MIKKVAIILGVLVLLFLAGGAWWLLRQQEEKPAIEEPRTVIVSTPIPVQSLLWNDPAGFLFNYDSNFKIDNHPEDKVNYANLSLAEAGKEGKILVLAQDTKYKDVSDWVKKDTSLTGGEIETITLGGKPAKKITFESSSKVVVGAIDQAILFTIELNPSLDSADQWQQKFTQITSTFEFWYPTPAAGQSSSGQSSGDIIEEEEIIQ